MSKLHKRNKIKEKDLEVKKEPKYKLLMQDLEERG